ncbi:MAG: 50S ribosomal protein L11 [Rickettsiaceae bacterium H1]|nr:50S ribosomal protein L11 [Rickettsiaceae bacterium H1]
MVNLSSVVRLKLKVGQMSPNPAIASVLGQRGVNIMKFLQQFNSLVKDYQQNCNVIILAKIFKDKNFDIIIKGRPSADLLKEKAGLSKGSSEPGKVSKGKLTMLEINEIAELKAKNIHNKNLSGIVKMLLGTAYSIGIIVEG